MASDQIERQMILYRKIVKAKYLILSLNNSSHLFAFYRQIVSFIIT
jgi:hypothetical protein